MASPATPPSLQTGSRLIEFYKISLENRTKLVSIIMVSGVAVAIPAAVDAYKAKIEQNTKVLSLQLEATLKEEGALLKDKEHQLEELKVRQGAIQEFSKTGLQQDIELRIRLAEYFAALSDNEYITKWSSYKQYLVQKFEKDRADLDSVYDQIDIEQSKPQKDDLKIRKLERKKAQLEAEFNPVVFGQRVSVSTPSETGYNLCIKVPPTLAQRPFVVRHVRDGAGKSPVLQAYKVDLPFPPPQADGKTCRELNFPQHVGVMFKVSVAYEGLEFASVKATLEGAGYTDVSEDSQPTVKRAWFILPDYIKIRNDDKGNIVDNFYLD